LGVLPLGEGQERFLCEGGKLVSPQRQLSGDLESDSGHPGDQERP